MRNIPRRPATAPKPRGISYQLLVEQKIGGRYLPTDRIQVLEHRNSGPETLGYIANRGDGWRFTDSLGKIGDPFPDPFQAVTHLGDHGAGGHYDEFGHSRSGFAFLYDADGACIRVTGLGYMRTSAFVAIVEAGGQNFVPPFPPSVVSFDVLRGTRYIIRGGVAIPNTYDPYP